jgi:hypothetical protein
MVGGRREISGGGSWISGRSKYGRQEVSGVVPVYLVDRNMGGSVPSL